MSTASWLKKKSKTIGSSEVGAVLGIDRFKTPYQIWQSKTGRGIKFNGNKATARGKALEAAVAAYYLDPTSESYPEYGLIPNGKNIIYNKDFPYMSATPDYWLCDPSDQKLLRGLAKKARDKYRDDVLSKKKKPSLDFSALYDTGKLKGIFECKTAMERTIELSQEYWICQQAWQLGIAHGKGYCGNVIILGVLDDRFDFSYTKTLYEDLKSLFDIAVDKVNDFWNENVIKDIEPIILPKDASVKFYDMAASKDAEPIIASHQLEELLKRYKSLKNESKANESEIEGIKEKINLAVGYSEVIVNTAGDTLATFKWQNGRSTFDTKKFSMEYPNLVDKFTNRSLPFRVLRIKD